MFLFPRPNVWSTDSSFTQGVVQTSYVDFGRMNTVDSQYNSVLYDINGLLQERGNFSALAMELRLSCNNPSILYTELWLTNVIVLLVIW